MIEEKGIVKEVYLPDENNSLIGFKILVNNKLVSVEEHQNSDNARIYREDLVTLKTDCINGKKVQTVLLDKDTSYE